METIQSLGGALQQARHAVVLTGAGASTDSGLPDFRSGTGLWAGVDPMKLASISALRRSPVEFFQFYRHRLSRLDGAFPNPVHNVLGDMQRAGIVKAIITQNVDGLHQAGGATDVIELHGSLRECVCMRCGERFSSALIDFEVTRPQEVPTCPVCGGVLKPGVVLFEEALPEEAIEAAVAHAYQADLFLVVGSSLEVSPANQLPALAALEGAKLGIINLEPTHLDGRAQWLIRDRAASVFLALKGVLGL